MECENVRARFCYHMSDLLIASFFFSVSLFRWWPGLSQLRASNEHILIVRVSRAGGRLATLPPHPSEAARCASV